MRSPRLRRRLRCGTPSSLLMPLGPRRDTPFMIQIATSDGNYGSRNDCSTLRSSLRRRLDDSTSSSSMMSTWRSPAGAPSSSTCRRVGVRRMQSRCYVNCCGSRRMRRDRKPFCAVACVLVWAYCVDMTTLQSSGTTVAAEDSTTSLWARLPARNPVQEVFQPQCRSFQQVMRLRGGMDSWSTQTPPPASSTPIGQDGDDPFGEGCGPDAAAGIFRMTGRWASAWEEDVSSYELDDVDHEDPLLWSIRSRHEFQSESEDKVLRTRRVNDARRIGKISGTPFLSAVSGTVASSGSVSHGDHRLKSASSNFQYRKTGTTIAGVLVEVDEGVAGEDDPFDATRRTRRRMVVVLGADTRATSGRIVADKNASKIHSLASNLFACGAGTSADLMHLTRQAQFTFRLTNSYTTDVGNENTTFISSSSPKEDSDGAASSDDDTNRAMSVNIHSACRWLQSALYEQGGSCQANLIVGGVQVPDRHSYPDPSSLLGPRVAVLRAIHPHGSADDVSYAALGSGGLAAMAVLESRYRPRVQSVQEAVALVTDAIRAGISNDLGSGSSIDLCILDSATGRATHIRSAIPEEILPSSPPVEPEEAADMSSSGESASTSMPGVNGFGNVPFTIRSARTIQCYDDTNDDIESAWDEILGLTGSILQKQQQ